MKKLLMLSKDIVINNGIRTSLFALFLSLLVESVILIPPIILGKIIDLYPYENTDMLNTYFYVFISISIFSAFLYPLKKTIISKIIEKSKKAIAFKWSYKVLSKNLRHISQKNTIEITEIFDRAVEYYGYMMARLIEGYIPSIIHLVLIVSYITFLEIYQIFPILIISSTVTIYVSKNFMPKLRSLSDLVNKADQVSKAFFADIFLAGRSIKMSDSNEPSLKDFSYQTQKMYDTLYLENKHEVLLATIKRLILWITQGIILLIGILLVEKSLGLSSGRVVEIYIYSTIFINTILDLAEVFPDVAFWSSDQSFMNDILNLPSRTSTSKNKKKHNDIPHSGVLKILEFHEIIDNEKKIKLEKPIEMSMGSNVSISGSSGSGKTFLGYMLSGIQTKNNRVFWQHHDIAEWNIDNLSKIFYLSTSNPHFLSGNFYQSVMYGIKISDIHLAKRLLQDLELENFTKYLSNTDMDFACENISSGEKKRLSIFRAMMLNRPVTIFDNPTEAIHTKLKNKIYQLLFDYFKKSTLICITHNAEIIRSSNIKIKIENNQIFV